MHKGLTLRDAFNDLSYNKIECGEILMQMAKKFCIGVADYFFN